MTLPDQTTMQWLSAMLWALRVCWELRRREEVW